MAEGSNFSETVGALFKGMDSFLTTKTVVGDAVRFEDGTIILPLVDVSFGVGAGAFQSGKNAAAGAMGGKISPNSVLVISGGSTKLVSVKNQDMVSKIFDAVPEIIDKIKKSPADKEKDAKMDEKAKKYMESSEEE